MEAAVVAEVSVVNLVRKKNGLTPLERFLASYLMPTAGAGG